MEDLIYARSFRDLLVYKKAFIVSRRIFELSKGFPEDGKYALTSQIRRASRSSGANITEAWAKRRYERHFVSKLTDADGEQMETQQWTGVAFSCRYLEGSTGRVAVADLEQIGRLLQGMTDKAESFCSVPRIGEETSSREQQFRAPPDTRLLTTDY